MSTHPLSRKQKACLAQLARQAFDKLDALGLIDAPGETTAKRLANWRHAMQAEACGESSLTLCIQNDYLPLRAHFNSLLGLDDKAYDDHIKSGPENDLAETNDTTEHRDQIIHLIEAEMEGTKFNLGYAIAIARNKFRKPKLKSLRTLTVNQLKQILFTIKNRISKSA